MDIILAAWIREILSPHQGRQMIQDHVVVSYLSSQHTSFSSTLILLTNKGIKFPEQPFDRFGHPKIVCARWPRMRGYRMPPRGRIQQNGSAEEFNSSLFFWPSAGGQFKGSRIGQSLWWIYGPSASFCCITVRYLDVRTHDMTINKNYF